MKEHLKNLPSRACDDHPLLLTISKSKEFRRGFSILSYVEKNLKTILENTYDDMNKEPNDDLEEVIVEAIKRYKKKR